MNNMFLTDIIERQKNNNEVAIKKGKEEISYMQLYNRVHKISNFLCIISNDSNNIAIIMDNSIEYIIAYFSILYANRVIIPIMPSVTAPELESVVDYCEVDILITNNTCYDGVVNKMSTYKKSKKVILNIDTGALVVINDKKDYTLKSCVNMSGNPNDVAIMLHTSGSMSNPKRVMLSHTNLIENVKSNVESLSLTNHETTLIALPMCFGYCNTTQILSHLFVGAKIVICDSIFTPKEFMKSVEINRVTNTVLVPTMLQTLLKYRYINKYNISSLKAICFGGEKMPLDKIKQLFERFPTVSFINTYGQTECSPRVTALLPEYSISKIGSVGKPIPGVKIRIINKDGMDCCSNENGELLVTGKNVMKGYYKQPELTKKTIQNGWIHTGDIGYVDLDGFLYITGRIKRMIISGGINIYPEEVEEVILQNKFIEDVYVFGENDDLLGEVPVAKIVAKCYVDIEALRDHCVHNLSKYKVPVRFYIVDSIPKTYNGKKTRGNKRFDSCE